MNIDFDKIISIYGTECVQVLMDNMENVSLNTGYLYDLGFDDVQDILERFPFLFIKSNNEFINIFSELFNIYGDNFVVSIEENLEILEKYNN